MKRATQRVSQRAVGAPQKRESSRLNDTANRLAASIGKQNWHGISSQFRPPSPSSLEPYPQFPDAIMAKWSSHHKTAAKCLSASGFVFPEFASSRLRATAKTSPIEQIHLSENRNRCP
ncbi:hypothetical protein [Pelagicoccus sp. SDUM812003]|uniref:hypothetical protein n=1 Tax=Pelagicoccus sp. SDUM812003 TaxID=3041267 RepID=UPI00280DEDA0|nr:hypothetical protein [Pelagicoccus sp. SDUM812003]MDQ8202892.1 hypothetical protein [Pelagicoccus sp. SDUM812003]